MTERAVIPIAEHRYSARIPEIPVRSAPPGGQLLDRFARRLHDLRISVTDRCNFRCTYCMPKSVFDKDYAFLPQSSLLSFEEIDRLVGVFVAHGVEKVRLTGGEPLLRRDLERLIEKLSVRRAASGKALEITLTTNAALLARKARVLRQAGLQRLTVSLDALEDATFRAMNDVDFPVADVLAGIDAAAREGLGPIKVNMVVKRGVNDHQILPMARHFRGSGVILRFIEFMDVGSSNGWRLRDVVPATEILRTLESEFALEALPAHYRGEVAERWRYRDGLGEVGVISSVTQPFCRDCSRARLSTEGRLYTCLFAREGFDLRALMRAGHHDEALSAAVGKIWSEREDRYSEIRTEETAASRKIEMSYIGG